MLPPGEPGELAIQGPQSCRATGTGPKPRHAFADRADGRWLRTGDVAVIDAEGYHLASSIASRT
jgi:acyl-CoA synthetase (AMP-forming)/AMP-acid ligase II